MIFLNNCNLVLRNINQNYNYILDLTSNLQRTKTASVKKDRANNKAKKAKKAANNKVLETSCS